MQILMTAEARQRTHSRLSSLGAELDIITFEADGTFQRNGTPVPAEAVDPEVFWLSLDAYSGPNPGARLGAFASQVMKGTKGRWIQVFSAGLDHPLFKALMDKGLRLTKSQAQSPAIADYVLSHALSLLHPIADQVAAQGRLEWCTVPFREVASTHWLLVGYGAIGQEIARRVKGFGAAVTVVRRNPGPDDLVDAVRLQSDLPGLLPDADVVVLACPLNAETLNLADAAFFAAMKPGALLINIGRGQLVDEDALRAGLDRRQPAHAVLDVFRTEPLPADAWFWSHPQVRVTGHASHAGDGVRGRGDSQFLENLRRYIDGRPLIAEAHPDEARL